MPHRLAPLALAVALAGCTDDGLRASAPGLPELGLCGGTALAGLIGQPSTSLPASGGWSTLRLIRPGDAVTEDFSASRLNVETDRQGRILRLSCG